VSEQRYHTVFQTSLDAISINRIDDGSFIDCNKAFLDTLDMNAMKSLGEPRRNWESGRMNATGRP